MDIETFYDENEARRESAEFEIGDEWTDAAGVLYELSWVEATGELYLMSLIDGWEDAMVQPNSLRWLAERFPATK